jgi:hypothetical protein
MLFHTLTILQVGSAMQMINLSQEIVTSTHEIIHILAVTQLPTSVPPLPCPASEYTEATFTPSGILSTSHLGPYQK